MKILLLLALAALSACSNGDETLATCTGPVFALNAGRWQPRPADLVAPHIGKSE